MTETLNKTLEDLLSGLSLYKRINKATESPPFNTRNSHGLAK